MTELMVLIIYIIKGKAAASAGIRSYLQHDRKSLSRDYSPDDGAHAGE